MKEIGGYIELDTYTLPMLHENAIKLNCGRNALAYLIEGKGIKKIAMPKFMCDACNVVLRKYSVIVRYYSIQDLILNQWILIWKMMNGCIWLIIMDKFRMFISVI